jgi:hypothetical protein
MEICNDRRHGDIVHDMKNCPACEAIDEGQDIIKDLERELDKANQKISELKGEI